MTILERIEIVKDFLNEFYGHNVCNQTFIDVSYCRRNEKLVIYFNKKEAIIRERRKGRGIQAMRIINCIYKRFGLGHPITNKTLVIGKDKPCTLLT